MQFKNYESIKGCISKAQISTELETKAQNSPIKIAKKISSIILYIFVFCIKSQVDGKQIEFCVLNKKINLKKVFLRKFE